MTYVLAGLGAAQAPRTAAEVDALRKAKQAELDRLLEQWNDAEFKTPPDRATQSRLDPQIAALSKQVNDLRAELRRLTGTKLDEGKVVTDEIVIKGKTQTSILPWVLGGLVAVLAIGAATRQKTRISPT